MISLNLIYPILIALLTSINKLNFCAENGSPQSSASLNGLVSSAKYFSPTEKAIIFNIENIFPIGYLKNGKVDYILSGRSLQGYMVKICFCLLQSQRSRM